MEWQLFRLIIRLALVVRELAVDLLLDSKDGRIEKLDDIIKDARKISDTHKDLSV